MAIRGMWKLVVMVVREEEEVVWAEVLRREQRRGWDKSRPKRARTRCVCVFVRDSVYDGVEC